MIFTEIKGSKVGELLGDKLYGPIGNTITVG